MFYDYFQKLCQRKGVKASHAAEAMGLSRSTVVKWKNGSTPSGATLQRMAVYFGVSADSLLHAGEPGASPAVEEPSFDEFTYALFDESRELTAENKQKLLELARFFKQEQDREGMPETRRDSQTTEEPET